MLRKSDESDQVMMTPVRIVPLDRARTLIILLVLLHHSVINYTYFGHGDPMRWLGFDLVVLFNDSFFMAFMFLISGLFVRDSLARKGAGFFLGVLLAFDAMAAAVWLVAPRLIAALGQLVFSLRSRPMAAFALFLVLSI